jgi:hypothetical protein
MTSKRITHNIGEQSYNKKLCDIESVILFIYGSFYNTVNSWIIFVLNDRMISK